MKKGLLLLLFFPLLTNASLIENEKGWFVWKEFTVGNNISYWALEMIQSKFEPDNPEEYIRYYSRIMKVNEDLMVGLAQCESGKNIHAKGDYRSETGEFLANGLFQFWLKTFLSFKKEAGMPELNYWSWKDQTKLAVWAWANGKGNHWYNCRKALLASR